MGEYAKAITKLEKDFVCELTKKIPSAQINSPLDNKVPGILSVTVPGLNSELFLKWASTDYALSTGSACALGEKSHVLSTVGKGEQTEDTIRVSIGRNNEINILNLIDIIVKYVDEYSI